MKIVYDAFDKTGIAETYIIKVCSLQDSSKDYLGDLVYDALEGDISLLDEFQREAVCLTFIYYSLLYSLKNCERIN